MLTWIEHVDPRQPPGRVGGQGHQNPVEPRDQRLDAGRVEHVGAILHRPADPGGLTGISPAFGQGKHQVHAGGAGVHRQRGDLQIPQRQPGEVGVVPGEVLPGQHHLHQRVMGHAAGGAEPLHQHLERHVLVLVGGQAAGSHLGHQLGDAGVPGQIDPQHQGVDEETHQLIQGGVAAPGDREPHRHIATGADRGQQHRQGGLHHHEAGRVVLPGHPGHLLLQLGRPVHGHTGPTLIGHRRVGPIGGKLPAARASRPARPASSPAGRRWGCRCRRGHRSWARCHSV